MFDTAGADLVYNIVEQTLTGTLDGTSFSAQAASGGRAGSKRAGVVNLFLANNPFATGVKRGSTPGGPLPLAKYTLHTHEKRSSWIRLLPAAGYRDLMKGRDGFAIHGRGKRGSDGCIVPTDFNVVKQIHGLVKAREQAGRPAPVLAVVAVGDLTRFERLNRTA